MLSMLATHWAALGMVVACALAVSFAVVALGAAKRRRQAEDRAIYAAAVAREAGQRLLRKEEEHARTEAQRVELQAEHRRLEARLKRMLAQIATLRAALSRAGIVEDDGGEPTLYLKTEEPGAPPVRSAPGKT